MARLRTLKAEFFLDEDLAELPFEARLLYQALWCQADREGRLEDRPKRIKVQAFPYDDVDADALLTLLHNAGFIIRYTVEDKAYIAIPNFLKHQTPHVKETSRGIPSPPGYGTATGHAPDMHGASTVQAPDKTDTCTPSIGVLGIGDGSGLLEAGNAAGASKPDRSPSKPDPKKGTRIPEDWEPSDADYEQMRSEFPDLTRPLMADALREFRDYWLSVPGAKGVKLRWNTAWRNDIRHKHRTGYWRTLPVHPNGNGAAPVPSLPDPDVLLRRQMEADERRRQEQARIARGER